MRAERRAQSTSVLPAGQAASLLYRLLMALVATMALLMVWRPRVVHGQEASAVEAAKPTEQATAQAAPAQAAGTTTHVVKAGETLWSLASRYYGDGHKWQDLAKRNGIGTDGSPLRVGMKLTVPSKRVASGAKAAATAAAPADSTVPRAALAKAGEGTLPTPAPAARAPRTTKPAGGSLAAQTAGKGNATGAKAQATAARTSAPANTPASASAAAPATATANTRPTETERANLTPQVGTMLGERGATRIGLVDQSTQAASRKGSEQQTIFHRDMPDAAEAERRTQAALRPNVPALRQAEFDAAPFVITDANQRASGEIVRRHGASAERDVAYPQRAIKTDQVEIRGPAGTTYQVGDRLISYVTQPVARGSKSEVIAIPTGVLQVVRAEGSTVVLAEVIRQSGRVEQGQRLVAVAGSAAPRTRTERLPAPDVSTTVQWLDTHELLPTLSSYLILGAGATQGLKAGDEIALYAPAPKGGSEIVAATARVVRVEPGTSAAVIVSQNSRDIAVGMTARRFAKAP